MMPKLYVAIFSPRQGNHEHWALYLRADDEHRLYEVLGENPTYERNVRKTDPCASRTLLELLFVGVLCCDDIDWIEAAAETVLIRNWTLEWDCQEYVLDILDVLQDQYVLDEDDEHYLEARRTLIEKRRSII